jgi:DNA (cytosine-5)-methyltransferase 1
MSWLYSQVLVEEYLGDISLDGEQSVQSSGSNILQAYCAPDKMKDFSRLSRFGMTFKPLKENLGEELLTLYLGAFHAPTFPQQEKEQELMEKPLECGEKWRGSFTKYDPDTSLWRTHQCSLLGDLEEFSETWPQWGLMRDGECWEQRTLEQTIRGTEYGLSPNGVDSFHTPNTTGLDGGSNSRKALKKKMENWPTPTAGLSKHGSSPEYWNNRIAKGRQSDTHMEVLKRMWPTPSTKGYGHAAEGMVSNLMDKIENGLITKLEAEQMLSLPKLENHRTWKKKWGTPKAQDSRHALMDRGKGNLGEQVSGLHNGGKLNPTWVEWLMGWPLGWTDLKPLEMDKCHFVPQQLGEF